jgi:histidyl-tRNA synthetase
LDTVLQRVRGTNDVLPPEARILRTMSLVLADVFERHGYQLIETPIIENLDLFLRKSGEEIAARTFSFTHWNRRICLRPELTASVVRAYVNGLQDQPLPVRLQYQGATFRYEKPQRGRYRQFTEVGLECIGGAPPLADAEMLFLACEGLRALDIGRYRLVVGHLGVVLQLLQQLGLEQQAQTLILGQMEHLGRRQADREAVVERLLRLIGIAERDGDGETELDLLPQLLAQFGPERATLLAYDLLQRANLDLEGGSRSTDEIVRRLLAKAHRPDQSAQVRAAVDFLALLHERAGAPESAFENLGALLREWSLDPGPLLEVQRALELFGCYGIKPPELVVDLSLGRGLRYYTGLVFEVYYDSADGPLQLCGGGRYDDLIRALGGKESVPACGFSFGLERLRMTQVRDVVPLHGTEVLVIPHAEADEPAAIAVSQQLRAAGRRVEIDVRGRGMKSSLRYADRQGIPVAILLGEQERQGSIVRVRDMRTRDERVIAVEGLPAAVQEALCG